MIQREVSPTPTHESKLLLAKGPVMWDRFAEQYIPINEEWANKEIANFLLLTADGYEVPILVEHGDNGERQGIIKSIYFQDGNLMAEAAWFNPEAKAKIESGQWAYVSGGWYGVTRHDGLRIERVLAEVSLASRPFVKMTPTILNSESSQEVPMDDKDKRIEALEAEIRALKAPALPPLNSVVVLNSERQEALGKLAKADPEAFSKVFGGATVPEAPAPTVAPLNQLLEAMSESGPAVDLTGKTFNEGDVDKLAKRLNVSFDKAADLLEQSGAVFGG